MPASVCLHLILRTDMKMTRTRGIQTLFFPASPKVTGKKKKKKIPHAIMENAQNALLLKLEKYTSTCVGFPLQQQRAAGEHAGFKGVFNKYCHDRLLYASGYLGLDDH